MSENVSTSATTREATVTAQPNVVYKTTDRPDSSHYVVIPNPPTPRPHPQQ